MARHLVRVRLCDHTGCTARITGDLKTTPPKTLQRQAFEAGWTTRGHRDFCPQHPHQEQQ